MYWLSRFFFYFLTPIQELNMWLIFIFVCVCFSLFVYFFLFSFFLSFIFFFLSPLFLSFFFYFFFFGRRSEWPASQFLSFSLSLSLSLSLTHTHTFKLDWDPLGGFTHNWRSKDIPKIINLNVIAYNRTVKSIDRSITQQNLSTRFSKRAFKPVFKLGILRLLFTPKNVFQWAH